MSYSVRLFDAEDSDLSRRRAAERRFKSALDEVIGDSDLVMPVFRAYQAISAAYGDPPDLEALTDAERAVASQWLAAEQAAMEAVFGSLRGMGDGLYELIPDPVDASAQTEGPGGPAALQ